MTTKRSNQQRSEPAWLGGESVRRSSRLKIHLVASMALLFASGVVRPLAAQEGSGTVTDDRSVEGTVVALEAGDLILDLGSTRGAVEGDLVELWRPLRVKHPVTGQILVDRFQIGRLRLVQARPTLSLAKPEGPTTRPPAAGDLVILHRAAPPSPVRSTSTSTPSPTPTTSTPASISSATDAEAQELSDLFVSLKGTPPAVRISAYERFVELYPHGRYVNVLWEEAKALRRLFGGAKTESGEAGSVAPKALSFEAPDRTVVGTPLQIALELEGTIAGAVLQFRRNGDLTYASVPMNAVGEGYFAALIPEDRVRPPGIEFFIEAIDAKSVATPVAGNAEAPLAVKVDDITRLAATPPFLATAAVWTDYASFNTKAANDFVWQTEGFVGARLGDEGFRALRSGFGVYRGKGGTLQELDTLGLNGRSVGLTYGYLETEVGFTPLSGIVLRGIIGLRQEGITGGAQMFFRVGNDRKTNLLFGGEVLGGIGLRGITQLEWNTFRRFPILLRTEVTNQPAGMGATDAPIAPSPPPPGGTPTPAVSQGQSEVGARAIVQVGYRLTSGLIIAGRVSYQGRTINHAGPGAGAAVTYEW